MVRPCCLVRHREEDFRENDWGFLLDLKLREEEGTEEEEIVHLVVEEEEEEEGDEKESRSMDTGRDRDQEVVEEEGGGALGTSI